MACNRDGTDTLFDVEKIWFADMRVDLTIGAKAATISASALKSLGDLYVCFFNRIPEASGLGYWIDQVSAGASLASVGNNFYNVGVQSGSPGYSASMTNADFVRLLYGNLGRKGSFAPSSGDIDYWAGQLTSGAITHGALVLAIVGGVRSYANDPTWGWMTSLLDKKGDVGHYFAVKSGLSYQIDSDNIAQCTAIAAAVTHTSIDAAIALIGVTDGFTLLQGG